VVTDIQENKQYFIETVYSIFYINNVNFLDKNKQIICCNIFGRLDKTSNKFLNTPNETFTTLFKNIKGG
jgi:hypothetical protein